jgi:hypothetical protein
MYLEESISEMFHKFVYFCVSLTSQIVELHETGSEFNQLLELISLSSRCSSVASPAGKFRYCSVRLLSVALYLIIAKRKFFPRKK